MFVAILDPRRRLAAQTVSAVLDRSGVTDRAQSGPLWLGWSDAVLHETPGGLVLLDGAPEGDAVAALEGLAAGDTRGVSSLRGAFAGLVWRNRPEAGAVIRDHFGCRPLFVTRQGGVSYVASEVADLLRMLPSRPPPDPDALALWIALQPLGARTLFATIAPLLPGHWLALGADVASARPFWTLEPRAGLAQLEPDEAADVLWNAIRRSVDRCLAGTQRPAVLLSGGLDSCAVIAAAAASAHERGSTAPGAFSVVFPDHPEANESGFIHAAATHVGAAEFQHAAKRRSLLADAGEFLRRWEVPQDFPGRGLFDGVLAIAASEGVDVMLDGEGGDDLFGCEPYLIGDLVVRGRWASAVGVATQVPGMGDRVSRRAAKVVLRTWVVGGLLPAHVRELTRRQEGREWVPETLRPAGRDTVMESLHANEWRRRRGPRWLAHKIHVISDGPAAKAAMDYLRRTGTMAEVRRRSALVDPDLASTVLGLPPALSFHRHRDKELLRLALRGSVPDEVRLRRDKTDFQSVPLESLVEVDAPALLGLLDGTPELDAYVELAAARAVLAEGPQRHPRGSAAWLFDAWRLATLAQWIGRQQGDPNPIPSFLDPCNVPSGTACWSRHEVDDGG